MAGWRRRSITANCSGAHALLPPAVMAFRRSRMVGAVGVAAFEAGGAAFWAAQVFSPMAAAKAAITMIRLLFWEKSMPDVTTDPCDSLQRLPSIRLEWPSNGRAQDCCN